MSEWGNPINGYGSSDLISNSAKMFLATHQKVDCRLIGWLDYSLYNTIIKYPTSLIYNTGRFSNYTYLGSWGRQEMGVRVGIPVLHSI